MNKKISVILVNYNGAKYNKECIDSLIATNYKNLDIIVVDNASTDNSISLLREIYEDKIELVLCKDNNGFSVANNIGMDIAIKNNSDYIMLLNNDTIVEENLFEELIKCSDRNNNSIICPKINYYDKKNYIWSAGGYINWNKGNAEHFGINKIDKKEFNKEKNIEFGTGCCMFIPRRILMDIGEMDKSYFLYFEDADYCMKAINKGYKIIYLPTTTVYHKVSSSTGGDETPLFIYYITRNRLIFNKKFNKNSPLIYLTYFYFTRAIRILKWVVEKRYDLIQATIHAINDFYKGKYGKRDEIY